MTILFTICGRAGSKGVKNKNLKGFLGYPLPFYTLSAIDLFVTRHPEMAYEVVLNTDSDALIELFSKARRLKIETIKREASLGLDNTPKVAAIGNCLQEIERRKAAPIDMVVDLDITSPLRTVKDIHSIIRKKMECDADVVFSVTDSRRNPYFNMVKSGARGYERVFSSQMNTRQEAPEVLDMNASLYAYSPDFLKSGKNIFEGKCDIIKMFDTAVLDIDSENDFNLMQVIADYLYGSNNDFNEIRDNIKNLII